MSRTDVVRARIEPGLKHEVEEILSQLGLNTADVINMLFHQIRLMQGIPFKVCLPNAETVKAIHDADNGIGLTKYDSVDQLLKSVLNSAENKNAKPLQERSKKRKK